MEKQKLYQEFWTKVKEEFNNRGVLDIIPFKSPPKKEWFAISAGCLDATFGIHYQSSRKEIWVNLRIPQNNDEQIKLFEYLFSLENQIIKSFGEPILQWEIRSKSQRFRCAFPFDLEEDSWDSIIPQIVDAMIRLVIVLDEPLQKYGRPSGSIPKKIKDSYISKKITPKQEVVTLDYFLLDKVFDGFNQQLYDDYGVRYSSMGHPYFRDRESHKLLIYQKGNQILDYHQWSKKDIGTGEILKKVIQAIELFEKKGLINNLVQWQAKRGEKSTSHYKLKLALSAPSAIEQLLFDLYRTDTDASTFEALIQQVGKRYDLLAYLFFLKNKSQYLPIAPNYFDQAFERIGVEHRTTRKCSWYNYQLYLAYIRSVQQYLQTKLEGDVYLLDAHSYLWSIISEEIYPKDEARTISLEIIDPQTLQQKSSNSSRQNNDRRITSDDFLEINRKKSISGKKGEQLVLEKEQTILLTIGKEDLARQVSNEPASIPSKGYDIDSFESDGTPKQIEVKVTQGKSFYLSRNELKKSQELPNYYIYLVSDINSVEPKIKVLKQPDLKDSTLFELIPENYKVQFE